MRSNTTKLVTQNPISLIVIFVVCCVVCFSPFFANQSQMIPCFFVFLCFASIMFSYRRWRNGVFFPFALFVLVDFFYQAIGISVGIGNSIVRCAFFLVFFLFIFMKNNIKPKVLKRIFYLIFTIVFANVVSNIYYGIKYPLASLMVISGAEFKGMNIGGTWFSITVLLFFDICVLMAINLSKTFHRLLFLAGAIISFIYLVFYGMRGSVVLFMIISLFFLLFYRYTKISPILRYLAVFIFAFCVFQFYLNEDALFNFLYDITPESRLHNKIRSIQTAMKYGVDEDSFSNRWGLYMLSLHTWLDSLQSLLFGIGEDKTIVAKTGFTLGGGLKIGGHSEFLDAFAKWGLLGVSFIIWYIVLSFKYIYHQFQDREIRKQVCVILFTFFLCFTFKCVFYTDIALLVFLLLPLSATIINKQ